MSLLAVFLGIFLLGFLALALDVAYLFRERRMAQTAADAAAVAAAEELTVGNVLSEQTVANALAKLNGFDTTLALNPATVTLSTPTTGNFTGPAYVQANVTLPVQTFFFSAFNHKVITMNVSASAIAGGSQGSPTCICLEAPTGTGLSMSNNGQIAAPNCGITVDSSSKNAVTVVGSAGINAMFLGTVSSDWDNSNNVNNAGTISSSTKIVQGITSQCKPQIAPPALPPNLPCYSNPIQGYGGLTNYTGVYALPMAGEVQMNNTVCFTTLDTSNARSVSFAPGYTYYVQGNFNTGGGAPITGSNVNFYVGGTLNIANGVTATLSAPLLNSVPQDLFYVAGSTVTIQGGSTSNLSGTLYAPNAAITMNNGTGTILNMALVGQTLSVAGGAKLNVYPTSSLGTLNSSVAKLAQ